MRRAHKCTKSKSEYFPVSGIFPTRTKKDLHRNNLRYTAVVLTVPRKGRPENPNGTKRTAFNVNVSCGRRGGKKRTANRRWRARWGSWWCLADRWRATQVPVWRMDNIRRASPEPDLRELPNFYLLTSKRERPALKLLVGPKTANAGPHRTAAWTYSGAISSCYPRRSGHHDSV
jgi:hypothetical protein